MADWARLANTTIRDYLKGEEVNTLRNFKLLSMMKQRGLITFGHSGLAKDWKVRFRQSEMIGYADADTLTFSRQNRWKTAVLPWRGYAKTDQVTEFERLQNKGTEAIVKIFTDMATLLLEEMGEQFGTQFYIDGNASGNEKKVHGVESFFSVSGASSGAPVGLPNDTYAGLSTTLGNYGGSWTGNWPIGTGDAEYDFFSPTVVDYTSTVANASGGWSPSTKTWPNTCEEAITFGLVKSIKNRGANGMIDLVLLNDDLYRQLHDKQYSKERLVVQRAGGKKGGLYSIGFEDYIVVDGVEITYEYGIASNIGYGFPMAQMELCCLSDQLFVPKGPVEDIAGDAHRFAIHFYGNLRCRSPRNFVKFNAVT